MRAIENLKRCFILCGAIVLWHAGEHGSAAASALGNPYEQVVTNRNLFQLTFPKPVEVGEPLPAPLREVKISGITALPNGTRAILRVMSAAKPPESAKEISLFLTAGGAGEDGVRVLEIDVARGRVMISNDGTLQVLKLAHTVSRR